MTAPATPTRRLDSDTMPANTLAAEIRTPICDLTHCSSSSRSAIPCALAANWLLPLTAPGGRHRGGLRRERGREDRLLSLAAEDVGQPDVAAVRLGEAPVGGCDRRRQRLARRRRVALAVLCHRQEQA